MLLSVLEVPAHHIQTSDSGLESTSFGLGSNYSDYLQEIKKMSRQYMNNYPTLCVYIAGLIMVSCCLR